MDLNFSTVFLVNRQLSFYLSIKVTKLYDYYTKVTK